MEVVKEEPKGESYSTDPAKKVEPPNSYQVEKDFIGTMMRSSENANIGIVNLKPHQFYSWPNRVIAEAIKEIYESGVTPDVTAVADALSAIPTKGKKGMTHLDSIGGRNTLSRLRLTASDEPQFEHWANRIADTYSYRRLMKVGEMAEDLGMTGVKDESQSAIAKIEEALYDIALETGDSSKTLSHIDEVSLDVIADLLEAIESEGDITGLDIGFRDLNNVLLGLHPSQMITVGGRPGASKTSFALNVASHVALREDKTVLFFSLEMARTELVQRVIASEAKVSVQKLRSGKLSEKDWHDVAQAHFSLKGAPLIIDDDPNVNMTDIKGKCLQVKRDMGSLSLVVVDYLQLMGSTSPSNYAPNRQNEISQISRGMKILAKELECPVMVLSQLNRDLEKRPDKRPQLSDLRESGSIEQDSDIVMFVYRDEMYYPTTAEQGVVEVIISKHRAGETGTAKLAWINQFTLFEDLAETTPPTTGGSSLAGIF